jgi:prepilin-type N-terminal cleavage/methylation domain-containing protein
MVRKPSSLRAFSLVELVIVVVIIGVIAAIAVPRISRGAKGAGESALRGSLAALRNSIDMYAAEHGGAWPGADALEATLIDQLTEKTLSDGTPDPSGTFGPYLRRGFPPVPVGPHAGTAKGVIMSTDTPLVVDESDATKGWVYNYQTGEIIANTDDPGESGDTYDTY